MAAALHRNRLRHRISQWVKPPPAALIASNKKNNAGRFIQLPAQWIGEVFLFFFKSLIQWWWLKWKEEIDKCVCACHCVAQHQGRHSEQLIKFRKLDKNDKGSHSKPDKLICVVPINMNTVTSLTDIGIMKGLRWKKALLKLNFGTECCEIWLYIRVDWQDITWKYWTAESQKVSCTVRVIHNSDFHFWKQQSMWFRQRGSNRWKYTTVTYFIQNLWNYYSERTAWIDKYGLTLKSADLMHLKAQCVIF